MTKAIRMLMKVKDSLFDTAMLRWKNYMHDHKAKVFQRAMFKHVSRIGN